MVWLKNHWTVLTRVTSRFSLTGAQGASLTASPHQGVLAPPAPGSSLCSDSQGLGLSFSVAGADGAQCSRAGSRRSRHLSAGTTQDLEHHLLVIPDFSGSDTSSFPLSQQSPGDKPHSLLFAFTLGAGTGTTDYHAVTETSWKTSICSSSALCDEAGAAHRRAVAGIAAPYVNVAVAEFNLLALGKGR